MADANSKRRGADLVVDALKLGGVSHIFALSGNHIMALFDALYGSGIEIIHTRHEAACVHMADAYARLTGKVGVALVTGGQGFTNAAAGLPTARAADSPVLLLSGDTPASEIGRGAFQELDQVAMSRPVTRQSERALTANDLGNGVIGALRSALGGAGGPVHLALPSDLLEAPTTAELSETPERIVRAPVAGDLERIAEQLGAARRPLLLAGPSFSRGENRQRLAAFEAATRIPALLMESPRGLADPSLGAFADVLAQADLIILAGKPLDFTLRYGAAPGIAPDARFVVIDADTALIEQAARAVPGRMAADVVADADATIRALTTLGWPGRASDWLDAVHAARDYRPSAWREARDSNGRVHPVALCRAVQDVLARDPKAVFVADGGEIGQWAQACITAPRRIVNGVAGSIGASIPFALAARVVEPDAPVVAVMGDGTFGFHMAEFDTAVRHGLPFVAAVGNDARWNAEHQIQLRSYGAARAHGCSLLPTRYDQVVTALGGYGEFVTRAEDVAPALQRAVASGKPACVNVMIDGLPAPLVKRPPA